MLRDWHTPGDAPPPAHHPVAAGEAPPARPARARPGPFQRATWSPESLEELAAQVTRGGDSLRRVPDARLLAAWQDTVAAFRDPGSAERRELAGPLASLTRLSPPGLDAALEAVLGGVASEHAARVFEAAAPRATAASPVLVILSSNLPALAVQPLLPILASRRPAILKSASAEPLFTPAFVAALARREPAVGEAVAALTWEGGSRALERPLLAAADRVLAYGDEETLTDLGRRLGRLGRRGKLVPYGPKTSLAVLGEAADPAAVADGLARDVALFDQRGCLSVAAVYTAGDPVELARELGRALERAARRWPPGTITAGEASAARQVRDAAAMRGALVLPAAPAASGDAANSRQEPRLATTDTLAGGTVIVAPEGPLQPTPGLRTVRVHPLSHPSQLNSHLAAWRGRLQGVALAGFDADTRRRIVASLTALGASRFAAPGELQTPDTRWHNGGVDPLEALRP